MNAAKPKAPARPRSKSAEPPLRMQGPPRKTSAIRSGWLLALVAALIPWTNSGAYEIDGLALVRDDGSLLINSQVIRLYGIYLPSTGRQCQTHIIPIRCADRTVLQLDFKVKGFVYCYPQTANSDGSLNAVCYVGRTFFEPGEDLGAHLVQNGWALATPEAPFEYQAMERIARTRELGVWGWPADSIRSRTPRNPHRE